MGAAYKYSSWPDNRYGNDTRSGPDFLEESRARAASTVLEYYSRVSILECLAESLGEKVEEQFSASKLWRSLALAQRKNIASRGISPIPVKQRRRGRDATKKVLGTGVPNNSDIGSISIPAEDFIDSSGDARKILVMRSYTSGNQIHLEGDGFVTYKMPSVVRPDSYWLSLVVVNVHRNQAPIDLLVSNAQDFGSSSKYTITVPYTAGNWSRSKHVSIDIKPSSYIKLSRESLSHGLTVKEITFLPQMRNGEISN